MMTILKSILVVLMLCLMILACGAGIQPDQVRIIDLPQFVCATSIPLPTHTQPPTSVAPPIYVPPIGSTPGSYVPRPTSTPRATYTPWPSPTPYVLSGGFHLGADVYAGGFDSVISLRLRIDDISVVSVDSDTQVVTWQIEIENTGQEVYAALPGGQVFIAAIESAQGPQAGQWWASAEAARAAGIDLTDADAVTLAPGDVLQMTLAAFTPVGTPARIGWILDPLAGGRNGNLIGGNVAYWLTDAHPPCQTNPGSSPVIPTPADSAPTPTVTLPADFPDWCSWCRRN